MSLETAVVAVLQAQCPRVYPSNAPLDTPRPFVTWEHIGGDPLRYIDGTAATNRMALLQVNVWAATKAQALSLGLAIEDALCTAPALSVSPNAAMQGRFEDAVEPPMYGSVQDFTVLGTR